ncbi:MAG: hypothetical protein P4N59_17720 [Negativicutes bacterium]|nr:hypothetical protein [Negativicutes bacterium]
MATITPTATTTATYNLDMATNSLNAGLSVLTGSGITDTTDTTSEATPAYLLAGTLAQLSQPTASTTATQQAVSAVQTLATSNYSAMGGIFSAYNQVNSLTPVEMQYLYNLPSDQTSAAAAVPAATTQTLKATSPLGGLLNTTA